MGSQRSFAFRLADVLHNKAHENYDLPVSGLPQLFPNDAYEGGVSLNGPIYLRAGLGLTKQYSDSNAVPIDYSVGTTDEMATQRVKYGVGRPELEGTNKPDDSLAFATFQVERSPTIQLFVWTLALAPLLLGARALHSR